MTPNSTAFDNGDAYILRLRSPGDTAIPAVALTVQCPRPMRFRRGDGRSGMYSQSPQRSTTTFVSFTISVAYMLPLLDSLVCSPNPTSLHILPIGTRLWLETGGSEGARLHGLHQTHRWRGPGAPYSHFRIHGRSASSNVSVVGMARLARMDGDSSVPSSAARQSFLIRVNWFIPVRLSQATLGSMRSQWLMFNPLQIMRGAAVKQQSFFSVSLFFCFPPL